METTEINRLAAKPLIPEQLFARLTARIGAEHPDLPDGMPARIMDQALAFLAACAVTTEPIGPSPTVDIGWHTFILYTQEYADFCQKIAGRFIHHVPDDEQELGSVGVTADCETGNCRCTKPPTADNKAGREHTAVVSPERGSLKTTVQAIRAAGYRVDKDLWPVSATSDCSQCHAGCHDSPTR